jgi:hydrogenase nickel incorporation protein HypA/HybF
MHELSIATNIVDTLTGELVGEEGPVVSIGIDVGVLSGVVPDALRFAWEAASRGSRLEGSRLEIREIDAVVHCDACDADRTLPSVDRLRCPVCDAYAPDLVKGRELQIREVELKNGN